MIDLPDNAKAFDYENNFYLSCGIGRISKMAAHYELFTMTEDLPGVIVECGVFKGASFVRFAMFRELRCNPFARPMIGFDTFATFPETEHKEDRDVRQRFIDDAGDQSITADQLTAVLEHKGCGRNTELVAGDICETVPRYCEEHPEFRISLLNLDTDIYEPAVAILKHMWERIVPGGVLVLDDYGVFPGETKAVDDYFAGTETVIRKFPFCSSPCYIVKE